MDPRDEMRDTQADAEAIRPRRGLPPTDPYARPADDDATATAATAPLTPSTPSRLLNGRYELGDVIGRGGMAEVRRAHDTRLGRQVAVKELRVDLASDPTFQARFRREAQSAAGLNHPNIVAVYDTGEERDPRTGMGVPYIVMELVEGQTLRDILRDGRKILPERALELAQGVLDALSYSHRAGIIHRDIKPANVMLTPQGHVKVMDFGIARAVADTSTSMTQTAAVIGTAQYLSPEQARGETVDNRSDIYSAGCLLYELLIGRPPFQGDSPVSVAYQHVRENPVPPSQLDEMVTPEMDAIVLKALAKDPAERYQNARDMRDDIARLLAGQEITASVPAVATFTEPEPAAPATPAEFFDEEDEEEPEKKRRAWPWIVALLVATVLAIGGVAAWYATSPAKPAAPAQVAVPRVQGNQRVAAENAIRDAQLKPVIIETEGPDDHTVGTVTEQNPVGGSQAVLGSEVKLTVNVGPRKAQIPGGLIGKNKDEARKMLEQAGFTAIELTPAASEPAGAKADTITMVEPAEGAQVPLSARVTLQFATGKTAVPDWTGLNRAGVEREAKKLGFTQLVFEDAEVTDSSQVGVVVNSHPTAGEMVARDARIVVYLGKLKPTPTPTPTPVPTHTPEATPTAPATPR